MIIQEILESLPLPRMDGYQFHLYQNRHYPLGTPDRFIVRVAGRSFKGNDVAQLFLDAKAYVEKLGKVCAGCGHFLEPQYFENGSDRCILC